MPFLNETHTLSFVVVPMHPKLSANSPKPTNFSNTVPFPHYSHHNPEDTHVPNNSIPKAEESNTHPSDSVDSQLPHRDNLVSRLCLDLEFVVVKSQRVFLRCRLQGLLVLRRDLRLAIPSRNRALLGLCGRLESVGFGGSQSPCRFCCGGNLVLWVLLRLGIEGAVTISGCVGCRDTSPVKKKALFHAAEAALNKEAISGCRALRITKSKRVS